MATELTIGTSVDLPKDEPPTLEGEAYNPEFPGSTADAPYGYKPDGTPYKRRPNGGGGKKRGSTSKRMPASDTAARSAASLLGRLNLLIGMAIQMNGMPETAATLTLANEQFENMAYEALLADPALCRKILGAGATSGKAGLVMAYATLGISIVPAARMEIVEKRKS